MTEIVTESYTVLDRQHPPSTQEIYTLGNNLGSTRTGGSVCSGGRHSVNASESVQIPGPETALQVDQQLLPSITEIHTSDHELEKSGTSDSEKASISIRVPAGPKTESLDIEHVPVQNDPRKWSSFRKVSFTQAPS